MDEISQWVIAALIETSLQPSWLSLKDKVLTLKKDFSPIAKGQKRRNKLCHLEKSKSIVNIL